tara:strand:- start:158 stop:400 length:243 start_codon:yes stop_codon:yes gene_type:complete
MSLDFVAEVWDVLRNHIDMHERKDAADTLVNLLIENNHDADSIKTSFRGEKEIITALKDYVSEHETEEEYDEDTEDEDEW